MSKLKPKFRIQFKENLIPLIYQLLIKILLVIKMKTLIRKILKTHFLFFKLISSLYHNKELNTMIIILYLENRLNMKKII